MVQAWAKAVPSSIILQSLVLSGFDITNSARYRARAARDKSGISLSTGKKGSYEVKKDQGA